ncbi:hypothetical protein G7K_2976-t1 [Saitoella complicata NRRL Y-17804]|uniref:Tc1-like transposase DDE domain-containing protein n=1 Tax=Saitoella complicata (strain BCRC 22490 / CBS 7301 / JCM 7358 / NBRC 10748 / NRRL Y-17804) TaxID=698492 RepID=A0A0E9NG06_SAICN|nr:hypothetical protein G7K_2976-t1 [Saitoella complicata NRRL Y-17804]
MGSLHKVGYTRRVFTVRAAQRNGMLWANHAIEMAYYTKDQLIFLDESAVDERSAHRKFGCAPAGNRAIEDRTLTHSKRWSALPALTPTGLRALWFFQGSFNADRFVEFIKEELLPIIGPYPGPNSIVVLDNCRSRHDPGVAELLVERAGCQIHFLPPYSPDLNPIELCFSMMKSWMKKNNEHEFAKSQPEDFIRRALDYINSQSDKLLNMFTNCG